MPTARKLRAVTPNEKPQPERILSLADAVETGDYRLILVAQRREIAQAIPEEKGPAKAALHRQLSIIAKELESLEAAAKQEAVEDAGSSIRDEEFDAEAL